MSWLSEMIHNPAGFTHKQPLKAGALALPAILAAIFGGPALAGAAGLGEAAAGAGAAGLGAAEAGAFGAAEAGGLGLGELAGAGALGAGELGGLGAESALAFAPEAAGGVGTFGGIALPEGVGLGTSETLSGFESALGYGVTGAPGGVEGAVAGPSMANTAFEFMSTPGAGGAFPAAGAELGAAAAAPAGPASLEMAAGLPYAGSAAGNALEAGTAASGQGGFLEQLVSGAKSSLVRNPLGAAAGAGLLGYNLLQGQKMSGELSQVAGAAGQLSEQGKQLMSYLNSGTLPPGLQQAVTNATASMKARIIANHARNGMGTDPSQNSALAQELNGVDMQAVALIADQGAKLLSQGLTATQFSTQLYTILEKFNREQSAGVGRAIATFASALGGGGSRVPARA